VGNIPEGAGNLIIIDHENGEYSVLAHFKKGSIVVKAGETVVSGQFIGLCGNSGHSSQPHLHYHLQTIPIIFTGEGLPAQFLSCISNGNFIDKGEPSFGEKIKNQ
jgi:murein DD-endopeptidase MepM/ murein hydrolase activator NlpD